MRFASRVMVTILLSACAISRRQEIGMGADYARQVDQQLPVVRTTEVANYLQLLGDSLARVADTRGLTWTFTLVNSSEVNAFALPGGWVYATRALVERTKTMDQFAGVLAHEISHVTRRHAVKQVEAIQRANVGLSLTCILTNVCESTAARVGIDVGGTALFASYSRDDERQADEDAVRLTYRARISPLGIPELLQTLLDERKDKPAGLDAWFRTHPYEEERIAYTKAAIAKLPQAEVAGRTRDTPRFAEFRARVIALPAPPKGK